MKQDERKEKYRALFNTPQGTEVLNDLIKYYNIQSASYKPDGNLNDAIYRDGQKSVVWWIINQSKEIKE